MTAPTNGAVSEETSRIAIILGMNVSVTSCTCVNAWSRAMTMPTAMAAATAGPDATITVHKADWTMSSASAWFMSLHRDAGAELQFLPVVQNGHRAAGDHPHARDRARDAAVVRGHRPPDQALGLGEGEGCVEGVELVVGLDRLLDAGEGGELRHELGRVRRVRRILVLHLGDEQLQERVVVERVGPARRACGGASRRLRADAAGWCHVHRIASGCCVGAGVRPTGDARSCVPGVIAGRPGSRW